MILTRVIYILAPAIVVISCTGIRAPIYTGPLLGDSVRVYSLPFPVNTSAHELFAAISGDGRWLYFARRLNPDTTWLYRAAIEPDHPPIISGAAERILTAATSLYFPTPVGDSGRYIVVGCNLPDGRGGCDLFDIRINDQAELVSFSNPEVLNTEEWESTPFFSRGSGELWFTRFRSDAVEGEEYGILDRPSTSYDLMVSRLGPDGWSSPIVAGDSINSPWQETSPSLGFNDSVLFFISDRPGGFGGSDIYVSFRGPTGVWGQPLNLGPRVNSPANENSVFLMPDYRHLLISSERKGEGSKGRSDLYVVDLLFEPLEDEK